MLRSTRGLLLLALVLIVGAVASTYYRQKRIQAGREPRPPKALDIGTEASANTWVWRKDEATHGLVEIRATRFRQLKAPSLVEIEDVEVLIYKQEGKEFDRIRTPKAQFDDDKGTLFSDTDVNIEMGVPVEGPPQGHQLKIRSTGVTYEAKTGKAYTDRPATFQFDEGDGTSVGAFYDPAAGQLVLKNQVLVNWRGHDPKNSLPMKIEAGSATYMEKESRIDLKGWSRLTKTTSVIDGGDAIITLKDGNIDQVDGQNVRGKDDDPGRKVEYSAGKVHLQMTPKGEVEKISGEPDAHLVSVTNSGRTTVSAFRAELEYDVSTGRSLLKQVTTTGNTTMESVPLPRPGGQTPETKVLRSGTVVLRMRAGGKEVDTIETMSPGRLEFLPTRSGQRHRTLDADHMFIAYGPDNTMQWFRAENAATHTDPLPQAPPKPGDKTHKPPEPILTWSKNLKADFEPGTGAMQHMEQWGDFRYQEGDRKAKADRAVLEQARNLITLNKDARIWDTTGNTSADRILLDQKSGDIEAEGNVTSTRMPDRKGDSSAILSNDEPLHAKAARMKTTGRNTRIHYGGQGNTPANAWQGSNRIWADDIDIDRTARSLSAKGRVRTQMVEKQKREDEPATDGATDGAAAKGDGIAKSGQRQAQSPVFVMVYSSALVYSETDRIAHYSGGSHMIRPGMDVQSNEIRAYLNDSKAESTLDHAVADGKVQIVRKELDRTLTGTGEHSEYYDKDQRIYLTGGEPVLVDSQRGTTRGAELTYYVNDDKLLVNDMEKKPVTTRLLRRHR